MSDQRQAKRLERFRELATERMERVSLLWMDLEQGSEEAKASLLRDLHTHKGDASITGFATIASLTHALESAMPAMLRSGAPSASDGDLFFEVVDAMGELLMDPPGSESELAKALITRLEAVGAGGGEESAPAAAAPTPAAAAPTPAAAAPEPPTPAFHEDAPTPPPPSDTPTPTPGAEKEGKRASTTGTFRSGEGTAVSGKGVRVRSDQLDYMRTLAGELILAKGRIERTAGHVRKERESAQRDHGAVTEAELVRRVENSLSGLESMLRSDITHLTGLVDALHSLSSDVRMVPISELFARYPRHIRELSRKLGKQVNVETKTHDTARLDREILHALEEPIQHLISNAIDHGVESPAEREKAGKSPSGTVTLSATLLGNTVEIGVEDDGAGININDVREKALAKGILTEAATDPSEILQCLLEPGMTTRSQASEVSGRGIGLDVVSSALRGVNGHLEIRSTEGQGTKFVITVPLSAAIVMLLTFRVGRGLYAIPAHSVTSIEQAAEQEYIESATGEAIRYRNRTIPVVNLQKILGEPSTETAREKTRIIVAHQGLSTWALASSYNHAQREAVLKPAGNLLRDDELIIAGSSLDSGEIALVLNLQALSNKRADRPVREVAAAKRHRALVVDDSPIIRELLSETLRSFGLDVVEGEDGADALRLMDISGTIDILVTDLDMPNIDGIDLIKAIRRRPGPRIPAIVVSTRGSDADQLAAMNAGADAYLVKTSFTKDGLWSLISQFIEV